jgi:hypothetical protein
MREPNRMRRQSVRYFRSPDRPAVRGDTELKPQS